MVEATNHIMPAQLMSLIVLKTVYVSSLLSKVGNLKHQIYDITALIKETLHVFWTGPLLLEYCQKHWWNLYWSSTKVRNKYLSISTNTNIIIVGLLTQITDH